MKNERIEALDGLRVVAIYMVMLLHFYALWGAPYYSYTVKTPDIFKYGGLGVQLFFIISGFVITLTLTKCKNFFEFMKRRFVRLISGMFICSLATFLFATFFDAGGLFPESKVIWNVFISDTFISPYFVNKIFHTNFMYIDPSYWSIWVEILFYVLGGSIYFLSPKNFLRNFSVIAFVTVALYHMPATMIANSHLPAVVAKILFIPVQICKVVLLFKYNLWFLAGIIVYKLFYDKKNVSLLIYLLVVLTLQALLLNEIHSICFVVLTTIVFLLFIYRTNSLAILSSPILRKTGVASYSIYLIHQNIGIITINRLSALFGSWNWMIPIFLIVLFSIFGIISYKYLETPLSQQLKSLLFKKKNTPTKTGDNIPVQTLP